MAVEKVDILQSLVLSARDLKTMTNWPDSLVNDYITNFQNIVTLATSTNDGADQINENTDNIAQNTSDIAQNAADIATNTASILSNSLAIATNTTNIATNATNLSNHIADTTTHGATGNIVGDEDFAQALVGGVVYLTALINSATPTTAVVTAPDPGAAPVAYSQAYAQLQTDLAQDCKLQHNNLINDVNAVILLFNQLIAAMKVSKQMSTI